MNDQEIIALYNIREESAIAVTDKQYGAYCRAIAMSILGNSEDAEECVNDTYWQAWITIPPKDPPCLKTYLGKITRYLSYHIYEKRLAAKRGGGEIALVLEELSECIPSRYSVEDEVDAAYLGALIKEFVSTLSSEEKWLFVHRCWYVEPVKDIALTLHITENYAKVMLHRVRKKLKKRLESEGVCI